MATQTYLTHNSEGERYLSWFCYRTIIIFKSWDNQFQKPETWQRTQDQGPKLTFLTSVPAGNLNKNFWSPAIDLWSPIFFAPCYFYNKKLKIHVLDIFILKKIVPGWLTFGKSRVSVKVLVKYFLIRSFQRITFWTEMLSILEWKYGKRHLPLSSFC